MSEFPFDKVTPTRLSEQIAGRIEESILSNQLRPGDRLPSERDLALRFGVSRTAVRESIKLLEERGLLESRNGRGAFVTAPGLGNITSTLNVAFRMQDCTALQLHEARWCLESFIVRLAAERATEADFARMEAAIKVMDASLSDAESFIPADVEFHAALAAATHNPLFVVMTEPLVSMIQNLGHTWFPFGNVLERHQAHERLLDCLKRRDASGAEDVIQHHLNLSRQAVERSEPAGRPAS